MLIKILLLVVFFGIMIGVGIYSRQHAKNVNDFILGGRSVGPWLTAFAYGTSYFSAVVFVGYAGQFGWKYGLSTTWIGIGNAVIGSLLAWIILGKRTRSMSVHLESATMPDLLGKRYDSKAIKIVSSAIVFIFLVPYTASIYNGLSRLFALAFDVPYEACVVAMAILTGIYVIMGGYMATAINDFVQGIIMLFGIVAIVLAVLNSQGGFVEAVQQLRDIPTSDIAVNGQNGAFASLFGPDAMNLLGVVILTSLGTWGLPQMVHKFYTIKDDKAIKIGTIVSTVFALIISGGCYFMGGFSRLFDHESLYNAEGGIIYDGVIPHMLSGLPDILIGVVIILVLSASMSTLSSLVLTSSSTLTLDFLKDNFIKNLSEKKQLAVIRILVGVFIFISVILAINPTTFIAQLMGISWGALAGAFLAPFLYGLYWKGVTKISVWVCFATGVGITVSNMLFNYMSPINAGALAMVVGFVVVPVISFITPKFEQVKVKKIFEAYDK